MVISEYAGEHRVLEDKDINRQGKQWRGYGNGLVECEKEGVWGQAL